MGSEVKRKTGLGAKWSLVKTNRVNFPENVPKALNGDCKTGLLLTTTALYKPYCCIFPLDYMNLECVVRIVSMHTLCVQFSCSSSWLNFNKLWSFKKREYLTPTKNDKHI